MLYYLIEPKDPLIIRSGRPFEEISDAQAARFPPPSTVAGALRNIHARSTGKTLDNKLLKLDNELLKLAVTGPLAVKRPINGDAPSEEHILVPKPADVQYFYDQQTQLTHLVRSKPMAFAEGEGCDLPNGLLPLFAENAPDGKPVSGPNWWSFNDLAAWRKGQSVSFERICQNGWMPAEPDIRTHIAINNHSRNVESGKLFQTTGLSMWQQRADHQPFPDACVSILAGIDGDITLPLLNLGGERRLAEVEACTLWPSLPSDLAQSITKAKGFTLTFLTPVLFNSGWLPSWLNDELIGTPPCCQSLTVKLRAAALERWIPQSGWDLVNNTPRAAQKMIPAGATYWFEIEGEATDEDIRSLWLAHFCDDPQSNLNGFGLALPAAYQFTL
ncbi:type III-B CRISPR module-associated protein Cmr3 [Vibrio mimicus]|uniref:CRISPR-associated protein Cmr3 n=1 Tax=Vibrio paracholerae TaxID=650003 RepID=A0ABX9FD94_9VIBR|nr:MULTISPECIES: type III-B CRISPR module-associated protein Cmr3 [Vibrio]EGQ7701088.1 CRISPR-associated protein Cmr3 [Vibrio cholerae]EGQ7707373.1 CRISPR-associated protein Cmr3 [Vibrio cholerae]EJH6263956.1 type III-B CRISPR module-associated protein Cmr3 [Vibrio cholerae]EJL6543121.1 type III-B CRISPR module-associated protein Cmr3 [Vibrio cholerae]EJT3082258.1 type III-B CRISPR module-associated protein Cmr3 [Vibrio cholerae]